jgi:hypothetical protein
MMPSHQGVRSHDGRHAIQCPPTKDLRFRGESPALVVVQPEFPAPHLFLEDPILLDEIGDDIGLVPVHDAGEGQEEDLHKVGRGQHRPILPGWECP